MQNKLRGPLSQSVHNLLQPMPLKRKLKLVVRNYWLKLRHRSTCCGHPGEPGC